MFTTILCPTDYSELSKRALTNASDIARRYNATLLLLSVVEIDPLMDNSAVPIAELMRTAESTMAQWVKDLEPSGIEVEWAVYQGMPEESILEHAQKKNADLIVMGSHGRRGLKRLIMGSVAETVVRRAHCPVLIIKQ